MLSKPIGYGHNHAPFWVLFFKVNFLASALLLLSLLGSCSQSGNEGTETEGKT